MGIQQMLLGTASVSPIVASGGTKSTPGDGFIYHVFTSSGSLVVTEGTGSEFNCLIVGGGGGGGFDRGGGGGAGGLYNGTRFKNGWCGNLSCVHRWWWSWKYDRPCSYS